jgi:hypothetical protein
MSLSGIIAALVFLLTKCAGIWAEIVKHPDNAIIRVLVRY